MKKTVLILGSLIILLGCQDGDDAAFFNNTNETVINVNVPNSIKFDRLNIPVIVNFYDNPEYSGAMTCSRSVMMYEENDQNKKKEITSTSMTHLDLLEIGDYYAFAYIDYNNNSEYDSNEPKKEFKEKIHTLKESRRTVKFNF